MLDRIIALLIFILILPFLAVFLLLVFIEDGNPVFFEQRRVGKHGRTFKFYKTRTMKRNTPQVASKELQNPDNYLLKVGAFYRKYSIDELPNIINILNGDMKFIGPRPLLASETNIQNLRSTYRITTLKPVITGWAQVNGRDAISDERKVVLERYYLKNKSLGLDLRILWKTISGVIKGDGTHAQ